jgi:hypothetical protein
VIKSMLTVLLYPFVALSALGLIFSMAVPIAALLGLHIPAQATWLLPGIFVVWLPTVITASVITKDANRSEFWSWRTSTLLRKALFSQAIFGEGIVFYSRFLYTLIAKI